MLYNTSEPIDADSLLAKVHFYIKQGCVVEMKKKRKPVSTPQRKYLHVLFGIYSIDTGYSKETVKRQIFKARINYDYFKIEEKNKITGEVIKSLKSVNDLDTLEMTNCIEKFRNHAMNDLGISLPAPDEHLKIQQATIYLARYGNAQYL